MKTTIVRAFIRTRRYVIVDPLVSSSRVLVPSTLHNLINALADDPRSQGLWSCIQNLERSKSSSELEILEREQVRGTIVGDSWAKTKAIVKMKEKDRWLGIGPRNLRRTSIPG
jgi:hypothetical protein